MHVLMKGLMEGLGASKRNPAVSRTKATDPAAARPFTEGEFRHLVSLMGGVHHVSAAPPQATGNG